MAATSFMRTWQDFDLIQLVDPAAVPVLGDVLPDRRLPGGAPGRRPADAAVPGRRPAPLAGGRRISPILLFHVAYLVADGVRRPVRRVAPARQAPAQVGRVDDRGPRGAGGADRRDRRLPALPAAGRVARARRASRRSRASATRRTGAGRCRASAIRTRGSSSSAWRRPPTAATGPAGCSRATRRATSCGRRCTRVGLADQPSARRAGRRADPDRRVHRGRGPLRAAGQQADARGARRRAPPFLVRELGAARRRPGARGARRVRLGCRAADDRGADRRGRAAAAEVRARCRGARRAVRRSSARTTRASRTRSPAS